MQLPNITLVLQLLHFGIVYIVLRRLVFGPVLKIIVVQAAYENKIQTNIQTWQSEYESIVARAQAQWTSMKYHLIKMIPFTQKSSSVLTTHVVRLSDQQLSEQQKQKMSDMIENSLSDIP